MLDPVCVTLAHSVLFQIDPQKEYSPERILGDGGARNFVAKPGVLADNHLLCLTSSSPLTSSHAT